MFNSCPSLNMLSATIQHWAAYILHSFHFLFSCLPGKVRDDSFQKGQLIYFEIRLRLICKSLARSCLSLCYKRLGWPSNPNLKGKGSFEVCRSSHVNPGSYFLLWIWIISQFYRPSQESEVETTLYLPTEIWGKGQGNNNAILLFFHKVNPILFQKTDPFNASWNIDSCLTAMDSFAQFYQCWLPTVS